RALVRKDNDCPTLRNEHLKPIDRLDSSAVFDCHRNLPRFNTLPSYASLIIFIVLVGAGCRSMPPLPPSDFSAPGWRVQQGQAVWKPTKQKPELAGELLLATRPNGNFFIQFTKTPFTLATARQADDRWQIDFGAGDHSWRGRGAPPARFIWFQLPRALA